MQLTFTLRTQTVHYITNITSLYYITLLTLQATDLLGSSVAGQQGRGCAVRRHAGAGGARRHRGLGRSGHRAAEVRDRSNILPPVKMQKRSELLSESPEDVCHVGEDGL